jgi:predicted transcriptional regulator
VLDIADVLGCSTRLKILRVLVRNFAPFWIREIQREIGLKGTGDLSRHVDILAKAGLVVVRERGHYMSFYADEKNEVVRFLRKLFNAAESRGM